MVSLPHIKLAEDKKTTLTLMSEHRLLLFAIIHTMVFDFSPLMQMQRVEGDLAALPTHHDIYY